jgi:hypothetical protein
VQAREFLCREALLCKAGVHVSNRLEMFGFTSDFILREVG